MNAVAKVNLPYVKAYNDRHGKRRFYYRKAGFKSVRLPENPGDPKFHAAYEKAVKEARRPSAPAAEGPGSIGFLIEEYYRSEAYLGFRPTTKANYRNELQAFRREHGTKRVERVEAIHIKAILQGMADRPWAAANLRKRLRAIFDLAVALEWREDNPVGRGKKTSRRVVGHIPWSEDDIETFKQYWPAGSKARLAMYLFLCVGQRRADVPGMGRQHVKDGLIRVVQSKGGKELWIPIHHELQAELDRLPADQMMFLLTEYGVPFTVAGLGKWFASRARMAGLQKRTAHGLRKSCGAFLAEADCTASQIQAILGHDSLGECEKYVRSADQKKLAKGAMAKLTANKSV